MSVLHEPQVRGHQESHAALIELQTGLDGTRAAVDRRPNGVFGEASRSCCPSRPFGRLSPPGGSRLTQRPCNLVVLGAWSLATTGMSASHARTQPPREPSYVLADRDATAR
jgi:hypothetical protein